MRMVTIAALVTSLLLAGCASSGSDTAGEKTSSPKPSGADPSPSATAGADTADDPAYFGTKNTNAINKVAAKAQSAGAKAGDVARIAACNKVDDYPLWRRCWHTLLDPYVTQLHGLGAVLTSLRGVKRPEACLAELGHGARTFHGFAARVHALVAGIDSSQRAKQVRSAKRYGATLDGIARRFSKPFQDLTQVCYSPKDLASINASPTPSS